MQKLLENGGFHSNLGHCIDNLSISSSWYRDAMKIWRDNCKSKHIYSSICPISCGRYISEVRDATSHVQSTIGRRTWRGHTSGWHTGLPVRLDEVHLNVLDAKTLNMHAGRRAGRATGCRLSARCITADLIPTSVVIHIERNLHFKNALVARDYVSFFFSRESTIFPAGLLSHKRSTGITRERVPLFAWKSMGVSRGEEWVGKEELGFDGMRSTSILRDKSQTRMRSIKANESIILRGGFSSDITYLTHEM